MPAPPADESTQMTYLEFFKLATGGRSCYPFQEAFAIADELPHLLCAPTGAGKTVTAILGWLWRLHSGKRTPRRLVYCLPMRVLVEQSVREAKSWTEALVANNVLEEPIPVHVLMGGIDTEDWFLYPEKPAILIGTQDMLLSRALNRGYAASRFHWPIDFGLLNNDCLWVFDEPQLMGSGVSTSAQLAGLRASLGTVGTCLSVWMSATLEPGWLDTIDFRGKFPGKPLELTAADYDPKRPLHKRMTAQKVLHSLSVASTKDMKEAAKAVLDKRIEGTQTLVVLNTVERAKALFAELKKPKGGPKTLLLIHSRYRPHEREALNEQLQDKGDATKDRIIVATQVVEAGVDISARTLITELAPWPSIVQRMGRCNRTGVDGPGEVYWIDLDEKQAAPYDPDDLAFARKQLANLDAQDVSPKALDEYKKREGIVLPFEHKHVLRRRDLIDLFDTSPDLSGNDIDIQRYVRGDDEQTDVPVFWRDIGKGGPKSDEPDASRRELCNVPINTFKDFVRKEKPDAFVWDHIDDEWRPIGERDVRPGLTILLSASAGGYSIDRGWDADSKATVRTARIDEGLPPESTGDDPYSSGPPLSIVEHTNHVCSELDSILGSLADLPDSWPVYLRKAARWHDVGKAHRAFQRGMRNANSLLSIDTLWAKSGVRRPLRHGRKYFRHELVSALTVLQGKLPFEIVYLVGAHHGKLRLSIRALPNECQPTAPETLFALGVHDGDMMPTVELGGEYSPELTLDLSPMRLGGETSWTGRALALRDRTGPFPLAFFEALLRAADARASQNEQKEMDHA